MLTRPHPTGCEQTDMYSSTYHYELFIFLVLLVGLLDCCKYYYNNLLQRLNNSDVESSISAIPISMRAYWGKLLFLLYM